MARALKKIKGVLDARASYRKKAAFVYTHVSMCNKKGTKTLLDGLKKKSSKKYKGELVSMELLKDAAKHKAQHKFARPKTSHHHHHHHHHHHGHKHHKHRHHKHRRHKHRRLRYLRLGRPHLRRKRPPIIRFVVLPKARRTKVARSPMPLRVASPRPTKPAPRAAAPPRSSWFLPDEGSPTKSPKAAAQKPPARSPKAAKPRSPNPRRRPRRKRPNQPAKRM